jgi:CHAT domain-containing protein/tetratricopeptide (TPR) repeat protein
LYPVGPGEERGVASLVDLVVANPQRVGADAAARLATGQFTGGRELAQLHWVIGRAEREAGHLDLARHHLEEALAVATEVGDADVLIGVQSSLAFALARLGDLDGAEKMLSAAEDLAAPLERARIMAQRGVVAYLRGDLARSAEVVLAACEELKRNRDFVNEARHRVNLGTVLIALGRYGVARRQLTRAVVVAERLGLDIVVGSARANLGVVSTLQGNLPGALNEFVEAERRHVASESESYLPLIHTDHARALADAGLLEDAEALLQRAIAMFRSQGQLIDLPTGLMRVAEVRLAMSDHSGALSAATEAARLFEAQGRDRWAALAQSVALRIRSREPDADDDLVAELVAKSDQLHDYGWLSEAMRARLVAARLAVALTPAGARPEDVPVPDPALRNAARLGRPADRILLAYVDATAAERRGDRGRARRSITHGLQVAVSAQAGLGAMETRAHAARYGYDLTEFGARLAIADGRPRELLERIEATRLMATRMPRLRPPEDETMAAMLTELRAVAARIADPNADTARRVEDEQQRAALERAVLRQARGTRGDAADARSWERELDDALALLGRRQLLSYAAVDGRLVAVSVARRRLRIHDLGRVSDVGARLDATAFALNRLNRQQGSVSSRRAADEMLSMATTELSDLLLPDEIADGDEPLVIVPTARLHDVPWGLLPRLVGRPVSVNPSVTAWGVAERLRLDRLAIHGGDRAAGLVVGPSLDHASAEVAMVGAHYERPVVLHGEDASVVRCLELVAQSDVVHFACHGSFRTDNPMFSSLRVDDGPLVVYDFERLSRFPETVVLSACRTANSRVLQGGSLLGLAAALITLGAANVVAPVAPISDASAGAVMTALHRAITGGATTAEALAHAVAQPGVDRATAGAFVTLGA